MKMPVNYDTGSTWNKTRLKAVYQEFDRIFSSCDLKNIHILDAGCGRGFWIEWLINKGADPRMIKGIDISAERIAEARQRFSGVEFVCGNAARLPWQDGAFDMVMQSTLLTSVIDDTVKKAVCTEISRVLKNEGFIVWYDFFYNNPFNKNVRGIGTREMRRLFPGFSVRLKKITLAPPLARMLSFFGPFVLSTLESARVLNTHYIGVLQKTTLHAGCMV